MATDADDRDEEAEKSPVERAIEHTEWAAEDDLPPHDPSPGDWYLDLWCKELCCVLSVEPWTEDKEVAMLLYEDGVLGDEGIPGLRNPENYLPVERAEDAISVENMAEVVRETKGTTSGRTEEVVANRSVLTYQDEEGV